MQKVFTLMAVVAILAFTSKITNTKATGQALQVDGIYIFSDSKPVSDYEYLGTLQPKTVQVGQTVTGQDGLSVCELTYTQLRDDIIKQVKKKYKTADAIILYPAESKADAVKFK